MDFRIKIIVYSSIEQNVSVYKVLTKFKLISKKFDATNVSPSQAFAFTVTSTEFWVITVLKCKISINHIKDIHQMDFLTQ